MEEYSFSDSSAWAEINGNFSSNCTLQLSKESKDAIIGGRLKIKILHFGGKLDIDNLKISISSLSGFISIMIGHDNSKVVFHKETSGVYDLRLWRNSYVEIGEKTTSNGVIVVCDKSTFISGKDCMFSDNILIQSADQHGIVDLKKGEIINNIERKIILGDHVWLGRRCVLMPDISIGNGAIVGTGSIVTKDIPAMSAAVGVPAKTIKTDISWSRSPIDLDDYSKKYVNSYSK